MAKALDARRARVFKMGDPRAGGAVFVGRPSKWGNPFTIGRDGTRDEVIQKYANWIVGQEHLMAAIAELIGRDLVCFCAPLPCHGDVLAALAEVSRFNATQNPDSAKGETK